MIEKIEQTCPVCEKRFVVGTPRRRNKYCSTECFRAKARIDGFRVANFEGDKLSTPKIEKAPDGRVPEPSRDH